MVSSLLKCCYCTLLQPVVLHWCDIIKEKEVERIMSSLRPDRQVQTIKATYDATESAQAIHARCQAIDSSASAHAEFPPFFGDFCGALSKQHMMPSAREGITAFVCSTAAPLAANCYCAPSHQCCAPPWSPTVRRPNFLELQRSSGCCCQSQKWR